MTVPVPDLLELARDLETYGTFLHDNPDNEQALRRAAELRQGIFIMPGPEPSARVQASRHLMAWWYLAPDGLPHLEHLARAAVLIRETHSKNPFYRKRGEAGGVDYWVDLSCSRPNAYSPEYVARELAKRGIVD